VDVDSLEKYDAAVTFDKSAEEPSKKAEKWIELATAAPVYKDLATQRANQWQHYAYELTAADKAREIRYAQMEQDWDKLKRIFALTTVTKETKQQYASAFLKAYGKVPMNNPYLPELLPYLPENALTDNELWEATLYMADMANHEFVDLAARLAATGNIFANAYLGVNKAEHAVQGMAQSGNRLAQFTVGLTYETGTNSIKKEDPTRALIWYRRAAENGGYAHEQFNLGQCYYKGNGVEKNYFEAASWFRKAAEQGYAPAQFMLGWMYENGEGLERDYTEAINWYTKAAQQQCAPAQINLAAMYSGGRGAGKDDLQAVTWLRKAAAQGYAPGQAKLCATYYVEQDYIQAIHWCRKAADQKDPDAQFLVGAFYNNGTGVEKNTIEAYAWFSLAAEQGHAAAIENMHNLATELTQDQLEQAKARATELATQIKMAK